MRVLVCGGRSYDNMGNVSSELDRAGVTHLICGGATGADELARRWAIAREIPHTVYPAQWNKLGNSAGPIRNQQMLDEGKPELVIAFQGGRGTQDMIDRAMKAGVPVMAHVSEIAAWLD